MIDIFSKTLYDYLELKNQRLRRRGVHIEVLTERTAQVERRFRETDVEGSFGAGFLNELDEKKRLLMNGRVFRD